VRPYVWVDEGGFNYPAEKAVVCRSVCLSVRPSVRRPAVATTTTTERNRSRRLEGTVGEGSRGDGGRARGTGDGMRKREPVLRAHVVAVRRRAGPRVPSDVLRTRAYNIVYDSLQTQTDTADDHLVPAHPPGTASSCGTPRVPLIPGHIKRRP